MNIIDFIPYGKENAISRKQLCQRCGLPDRIMRKQIERERQEYAILNAQDGSGYFRPTAEEKPLVTRWIRQERSRSNSVNKSIRGAERFVTGDTSDIITVSSYTRRKHKRWEPAQQLDGQMRW